MRVFSTLILVLLFCVSADAASPDLDCARILHSLENGVNLWKIVGSPRHQGYLKAALKTPDSHIPFLHLEVIAYQGIKGVRGEGARLLQFVRSEFAKTPIMGVMTSKNYLEFIEAIDINAFAPDFRRIPFISALGENFSLWTDIIPSPHGLVIQPPRVIMYPKTENTETSGLWLDPSGLLGNPWYWHWVRENRRHP